MKHPALCRFFGAFFQFFIVLFVFSLYLDVAIAGSRGIMPLPLQAQFDPLLEKQFSLTIGVPHNYAERGIILPPASGGIYAVQLPDKKYIYANEYQLLDWLENARVDGAYLPATSLELLKQLAANNQAESYRVIEVDKQHQYTSAIGAIENGIAVVNPLAVYESVLKDLKNNKQVNFRLVFNTHLDPSLYALYKYTQQWMQEQSHSAKTNESIWTRLIDALQFVTKVDLNALSQEKMLVFYGAQVITCQSEANSIACIDKKPQPDYLVIRYEVLEESVFEKLFGQQKQVEKLITDNAVDSLIHNTEKSLGLAPVQQFVMDNYLSHQFGINTRRYFRFRIPELFNIIESSGLTQDMVNSQVTTEDKNLSLVLTGGGVKAAYQTTLIDYLYRTDGGNNPFLINKHDSRRDRMTGNNDETPFPLTVDSVIGTSGGALLGLFVASHDSKDQINYTDHLWRKEDGRFLTSLNVFPGIDLMRWLSLLASLIIFLVVITALSHLPSHSKKYGLDIKSSLKHFTDELSFDRDEVSRFRSFTLVWIVFMLLSPWLIKYVNGDVYREHVPAIQGLVYFAMALIAVNTDNHIVKRKTRHAGIDKFPMRWIATGVAGLVFAIAPAIWKAWADTQGANYINIMEAPYSRYHITLTPQALLCILGLLLLALTLRKWFHKYSVCFYPVESKREMNRAFLVPLTVVVISSLLVWILFQLKIATIFELTLNFIAYLALCTIITSVTCFYMAFALPENNGLRQKIEPYLRYLLLPHPSKTFSLPLNRLMRMTVLFTGAFIWWNVVIAPGLYGNDTAKGYIEGIWTQVQKVRNAEDDVRFTAYYVAPATSLDNNIERYFLFDPGHPPSQASSNDRQVIALPYELQKSISADRRWTQFKYGQLSTTDNNEGLRAIAFASGSPFPVFPAHNIKLSLKDSDEKQPLSEWLVDGGYAHNIPIEAAKKLGASHVLIVSASPMTPEYKEDEEPSFFEAGLMTRNLTRLIPYFYNRSQIEDVLSANEMFVAAIAPPLPSDDERSWPLLTDFRASVIEYLLGEANEDIDQRIGFVQNWGRPQNDNLNN